MPPSIRKLGVFSAGCVLLSLAAGCPSQLAPPPGEPIQTPIPQNQPVGTTVVLQFPLPAGQPSQSMIVTDTISWSTDAVIGSGMADYSEGSGADAAFNYPWNLGLTADGTALLADRFNHRIRQIKGNQVSTLAGQREPGLTDGQGAASRFNNPQGLALGPKGDIFVADTGSSALRQITPAGLVSTLSKELTTPAGLTVAANGDVLVADSGANRIVLWKAATRQLGLVTPRTEQGSKDGPASQASFFSPRGLVLTPNGNVFVSDSLNHVIRQISPGGVVSTLAGTGKSGFADGKGTGAAFNEPGQIALDGNGNLLVVDAGNGKIRRVTQAGDVTTLNLPGAIIHAQGLALSKDFLWVSDSSSHKVYRLKPTSK